MDEDGTKVIILSRPQGRKKFDGDKQLIPAGDACQKTDSTEAKQSRTKPRRRRAQKRLLVLRDDDDDDVR